MGGSSLSWSAGLLDLGGVISGDEQQLAHGIVPAYASEGSVVVGTNPGSIVSPGTDSWFILPAFDIPPDSATHVGYEFSFDHWYDLESGDGVWLEHRLSDGSEWDNWTWTSLDPRVNTGGYPDSISESSIDIEGIPSGGLIPVFGGDTHSGWVSTELNMSNVSSITSNSEIKFRFRIHTSALSVGSPGWFLDNISYRNAGTGTAVWHHGCDVNGSTSGAYGNSCYYSNNALGTLNLGTFDLSSSSNIEFDLHWDLEGSGWDNACIEISTTGTSWYDITSTGGGGSTTSQCRYRSGPIPGLSLIHI